MGGESLSVERGTENSRKSVQDHIVLLLHKIMCTIPGSVVVIVPKRKCWPGNRCTNCHSKLSETKSEFLSYTQPLSPEQKIK